MRVNKESEKAGLKLSIQKTKIMGSGPIISWQIGVGGEWKQWQILFSWASKSLWIMTPVITLKDACSLEGKLWHPRQHIKTQRHHYANKSNSILKVMVFPLVNRTWQLDDKKGWAPKNWCFWTVVLEKTLESPLDFKEVKPVNPKGNQSWIFIGRTDAEAEAPILWPPDTKNWLIGKDSDAGKDWGQEEKGMTENEMVG